MHTVCRLIAGFMVLNLNLVAVVHAAPVEIAVEDAAPPWSYGDGTGFADDLVREAFKRCGVEARLAVQPYARCKLSVEEGLIPACFSMSPDQSLHDVTFSARPLFHFYSDYFYRLKSPPKYSHEADIPAGTTVAIVRSYEYPPSVTALRQRGVILVEGPSESSNLQKLALGRVDLATVNQNPIKSGAQLIERLKLGKQVVYGFSGGRLDAFIGFSNKHPDGSRLRECFNRGYDQIIEDGTEHEIEMRWTMKLAN